MRAGPGVGENVREQNSSKWQCEECRWPRYSHVSDDDRFCVVRNTALGAAWGGREDAQSFVAASTRTRRSRGERSIPCEREGSLHDGGEVRHVPVVLCVERVRPGRVELVDLGLQTRIHIRVRQETVHDARERDGRCVRPGNDGNDTIAGKLMQWYSNLARNIFVVL